MQKIKFKKIGNQFCIFYENAWVPLLEIEEFQNDIGELVCLELGKYFDFMPTHDPKKSLHQLPPIFWKNKNLFPKSLTFYSGTFFPWHQGHEACLKAFPISGSLLVLPDKNPWKENIDRGCAWKFFRDLLLKYEDSPYSFYPGFLGLKEKNPTYSWLSKTLIPQKSLLLGDDTFLDLEKWYESKKLISLLDCIYVVPRLEAEEKLDAQFLKLKEINEHLYIKRLKHHAFENLSSTKLRK